MGFDINDVEIEFGLDDNLGVIAIYKCPVCNASNNVSFDGSSQGDILSCPCGNFHLKLGDDIVSNARSEIEEALKFFGKKGA